ncbi:MAG: hydrogenase iron-sulfur subunit, partial [Clostridiales bacterium]
MPQIDQVEQKIIDAVGENDFEPKILAFCCNWCTYAGADLAGLNRMK